MQFKLESRRGLSDMVRYWLVEIDSETNRNGFDRKDKYCILWQLRICYVMTMQLEAIAFYLKVHNVGLGAVPTLVVTDILVYIGSFPIGIEAVPWVVMSETGTIATLVKWFGGWLCSYTFNFLTSLSSYAHVPFLMAKYDNSSKSPCLRMIITNFPK
ncbi:unnamed protein product [Vicia faba]|uniref:Uncharacterized protein n=1 Tax=Vicia faba TaxID=3906 RepID=A0AAV1A9P2_VICFA|nr:unnamed protein product [Vicia faba]